MGKYQGYEKYKDSGVEWLGEIPKHWKTIRLRNACSDIFLGLTGKVDYVDFGGFPLVRAINIKNEKLDFSDIRFISEEQHKFLTKKHKAKKDDVLLTKSGSIGVAALVDTDQEFSIYESIFVLRAIQNIILPVFLLRFITSDYCTAKYKRNIVGMGVGHLNMSDIIDVTIALPPLDEQQDVLNTNQNKPT
ncbi:restriction endonuclease subunit S [Scytonema sp. PCC 10023]|uniref:restriction endonuclease subunit S n=1 Tax=Scytonema sp. PCC 10023 TaxID=1680591 RepID=UPI0039C66A08